MRFISNANGQLACVIHCRVSTPKQAYEGESLDVQASVCTDIATNNGWKIAHEPWKESFSGRKSHRPVFQDVLAFLDSNPGLVQYYLFRSIDRATRGGSFSYEQIKRALLSRGVMMVDSYGIIQPVKNTLHELGFEYEWSMTSPSEIAEVVMATSAKADLTNILTRLIGQEIRLRQRGYKIRHAADGFVNARIVVEGRKRVIERPDPERAQYFVALFEMRAAGQLSDKTICERVNAMGYRTRQFNRWDAGHQNILGVTGGKPLTPKRLQQIVARPIYCGIICEKWTRWQPVKAAYDGLVSIETFNAANRGKVAIRANRDGFDIAHNERGVTKRSKDNPLFPFRKVIGCPLCRKPLLGSSSRGRSGQRFPIYHCSRSHKYFGVAKAALESAVAEYVANLRFRVEAVIAIREVLITRYDEQRTRIEDIRHHARVRITELELRKAEAIRAFTFATIDTMRRGIEAKLEVLEREVGEAIVVRENLRITQNDIEGFLEQARLLMEHPYILLENPANTRQLETLYGVVFEECPTYSEIANGTAKLAWVFYVFSDSVTVESALVRLRTLEWNQIENTILKWKAARDDLQLLLQHASSKHRSRKRPPQRP